MDMNKKIDDWYDDDDIGNSITEHPQDQPSSSSSSTSSIYSIYAEKSKPSFMSPTTPTNQSYKDSFSKLMNEFSNHSDPAQKRLSLKHSSSSNHDNKSPKKAKKGYSAINTL